jgi:hypothetical protein
MRKNGVRVNLFSAGPFIRGMRFSGPNLVPLLDVMFVLLLFILIGNDFGIRELEEVRLADARSMPECKESRVRPRPLIINAYHRTDWHCDDYPLRRLCRSADHWRLDVLGRDCTTPAALDAVLQDRKTWRHGRSFSARRVEIRPDAEAPAGLAQLALAGCARQGIYEIDVAARRPVAGRSEP